MDYDAYIKSSESGVFTLAFSDLTPKAVQGLLDPALPIVFLQWHRPVQYGEWWTPTDIPVTRTQIIKGIEIRFLAYEAMLGVDMFAANVASFMENELTFYQFNKRVPHTLSTDYMAKGKRDVQWEQNGLGAGLQWPGTGDVAVYWNRDRAWLEKCVQKPEIQEVLL